MSAYSQDLYLTRYTLLHRIQSQVDEVAWKDFTDQYRLYIYAIINRMNIKATDADDLYQKILLKLWKKMGRWNTLLSSQLLLLIQHLFNF